MCLYVWGGVKNSLSSADVLCGGACMLVTVLVWGLGGGGDLYFTSWEFSLSILESCCYSTA